MLQAGQLPTHMAPIALVQQQQQPAPQLMPQGTSSASTSAPQPGGAPVGADGSAAPNNGSTPHHPIAEFLYQLTKMLTDNNNEIIEWSSGKIKVHHPERLEGEVLHKYFRHSKFASFQRQLNYFGFRKFAGKGKMAPCSYVNEAATSDLRSLLLIKVRFAVLSREPKSRWVPTVVVVIVAVALNDRLLFLGSCTKMKTHKDTERAKKRERKTCTNSYTSESYPPTCILIF